VAGIIVALATALAALQILAAGMSDSPSAADSVGGSAKWTFITGLVLGAAVAATHWISFPSW
jgi:hypothetical protein